MIRCVKKRIKHRTYICFFIAIIACNSDSEFNSKPINESIYDNENAFLHNNSSYIKLKPHNIVYES